MELSSHPTVRRIREKESASMWQRLSFGSHPKSAYCVAACPAGEEVIQPFLKSRRDFTAEVVRPLQERVESLYVVPGSDADATTWLGLIRGERSLLWALLTWRVRVRGPIGLLRRFGRCFPS